MAVKPVKIVTDLLTNKQIIKQDINENILFRVSGTLGNGHVSSSLPITGSDIYVSGKIYPGLDALADVSASNATNGLFLKRVNGKWVPASIEVGTISISTTGSVEGDGTNLSPIKLKEQIAVTALTSSYIQLAGPIVNNPNSPTPFSSTEVDPGFTKNIDEFSQIYSAAKYIILAKSINHSQIAEVIVVKDPTSVRAIPYAIGHTSNSPIATFGVQKNDINSTIELFITNTHLSTITVTMQRSYLI